jgi:membrane protease YdiL (CAAX protease family)
MCIGEKILSNEVISEKGSARFVIAGGKLIGYFLLWTLLVQLVHYFDVQLPEFIPQTQLNEEIFRQLIVFVSMLISNTFFVWCVDRGKTRTRLVAKRKFLHDLIVGVAFGLMWAGGAVALYQITGSSDLSDHEYFSGIWLWLIPVAINVVAQEYMFRGYMFTLMQKNCNNVAAVVVPSIIYLILHPLHVSGGLIAVLDVTTAGFLLSMLRYHTKGILVPIIVHFFWNASTGVILGTIDLGDYPSIFMNSLVTNGNELLHGGKLGFEASAITLIVTALLIDLVSVLINDVRHPETVKYVIGGKKKAAASKRVEEDKPETLADHNAKLAGNKSENQFATPFADDQVNASPF